MSSFEHRVAAVILGNIIYSVGVQASCAWARHDCEDNPLRRYESRRFLQQSGAEYA